MTVSASSIGGLIKDTFRGMLEEMDRRAKLTPEQCAAEDAEAQRKWEAKEAAREALRHAQRVRVGPLRVSSAFATLRNLASRDEPLDSDYGYCVLCGPSWDHPDELMHADDCPWLIATSFYPPEAS